MCRNLANEINKMRTVTVTFIIMSNQCVSLKDRNMATFFA